MGQFTQAIAAYKEAIFLQPHNADAHQNLGVTLLKVGQVQESLNALDRKSVV